MGSQILRVSGVILVASVFVGVARAQEKPETASSEEVKALRIEIQELRDQIQLLQQQVAALTAATAPATAPAAAPAPPAAPTPPPVEETPPTPAGAPGSTAPARSQSLLNPAISAVFQTIGTTSLSSESDANGFSLSEAEVAFQSVVDPYAKMDLYLTFPAGDTPEVEEGFVSTLALPASLQLKGGRFKNAFGKWNTLHNHAFFTVDRPLALENFLGDESMTTDGLSLSVLIPNPWDLYLESTTEIGTALEGVSFNSVHRDLTGLEHLSAFFNASADSTLEFGLSAAAGKVGPTDSLERDLEEAGLSGTLEPRETLDSRIFGFDATYKWKPLQRNVYQSFLWQTEILNSRREVQVLTAAQTLDSDHVSSLGGYSYWEYQFVKRWRGGLRYDLSGLPDSELARESAIAGVIRFQPSEFQELRFEIRATRRNDAAAQLFDGDRNDTQLYFEWIPVIGAHGAHKY